MPVQLVHSLPTEEHPLELLFACHDKVRHFTALAGRLALHVSHQGADAEAQQAAANILRYFDLALPKHHADEEEDVFPALRALQDMRLTQALDSLLREHERLDAYWQVVQPWLTRIAQGEAPAASPLVLPRFVAEYQAHAEREERDVFSAIERLPQATVAAIAARMCARRGA